MRGLYSIMLTMSILIGSIILAPAYATVQPAYWEDTPPSSLQISDGGVSTKQYGYITHQNTLANVVDDTFQSDSAKRWGQTTTSKTYHINMDGAVPRSGFSQADLRAAIVDAVSNWHDTLSASSAVLQFNDGGDTSRTPSQLAFECGIGGNTADGLHDIGFCNLDPPLKGLVKTTGTMSSGGSATITEVDTVFDAATTWYPTSGTCCVLYNVALHEAGHWQFLGDMYSQLDNLCTYESSVMCNADNNGFGTSFLAWGDKDGARFLYPKQYPITLSATGSIKGSDSAVASIDSSLNSIPDMMFVWADYNSATGSNTIKGKGIWDISSSTGAGTIGTTVTLDSICCTALTDIGVTLADVGGSSTKRDLILSYAVGSGTTVSYTVLMDITRSSNSFTFTSPTFLDSVDFSDGDRGTDVAVFDMDGNGQKDLVVFDSFDGGLGLKIYYYYGTLTSSGQITTWNVGNSAGTHGINDQEDVGISFPYPADRIGTLAYEDNSNRMRQHYFHFLTTSKIDQHIKNSFAPRKNINTILGLGAGDAYDIGERIYPEQFFSWVDSAGTGYYMVEWDSRLNSHV